MRNMFLVASILAVVTVGAMAQADRPDDVGVGAQRHVGRCQVRKVRLRSRSVLPNTKLVEPVDGGLRLARGRKGRARPGRARRDAGDQKACAATRPRTSVDYQPPPPPSLADAAPGFAPDPAAFWALWVGLG